MSLDFEAIPYSVSYSYISRSIQDPTPSEETAEVEHELTYEVIPAGTQKGKDLLVDSLGYSYNVKVNNSPFMLVVMVHKNKII